MSESPGEVQKIFIDTSQLAARQFIFYTKISNADFCKIVGAQSRLAGCPYRSRYISPLNVELLASICSF